MTYAYVYGECRSLDAALDALQVADHTTFANQGNGRRLYPDDLQERVLPALRGIDGGILMHLPTYAVPNGRALGGVIASVDPLMEQGDFIRPCDEVQIPGRNMMSLIYARNVPWTNDLGNLPADFTVWLDGVERR